MPLLRRLSHFAELSPAEVEQVNELAALRRRWRAGTTVSAEGRAAGAHFLLSGWACSQRVLRDGRRQIFDFIVAGEGFGFGAAAERPARQAVVALTAIETVDVSVLLNAARDTAPNGLWSAIQAMIQVEDARRFDHMLRLGRLTAYEKVAHFALEMQRRAGVVGARSFSLPLTQETIADALGLSVVHLNRVLRRLRAEGLLELRGGTAMSPDPRALAVAAVLAPSDESPPTP